MNKPTQQSIEKFEIHNHLPTWCSGCGDFAIWRALKLALAKMGRDPSQTVLVFGIGCSGNMADKIRAYTFHGLHGRAIPAAEGIKLANHHMPVIVVGGDGDGYGEGMGHFIHSIRGNHDITYIVHNNAVYGLTKGQTAPTSAKGFKTNSTPAGSINDPVNPVLLALAAGATFVARGFSSEVDHLTQLILNGVDHRGFALIDVLQPCVTFNHINTYEFYRKRIYKLEDDPTHSTNVRSAAMIKAGEWGDRIPIGIFLQEEDRPAYHEEIPQLAASTLAERPLQVPDLAPLFEEFY